jgi:hypothetical protein
MNTTTFIELLDSHDWYYMMSDDFSVWQKGEDSLDLINKLRIEHDDLDEAYIQYTEKRFGAK